MAAVAGYTSYTGKVAYTNNCLSGTTWEDL